MEAKAQSCTCSPNLFVFQAYVCHVHPLASRVTQTVTLEVLRAAARGHAPHPGGAVASSVEQQSGDGGDRRHERGGAWQRGGGAAAEGLGRPAFPLRPVVGHLDNSVFDSGRLEEVEELGRGVRIVVHARDDQIVATCVRVEIVVPPFVRTLRSAGGGATVSERGGWASGRRWAWAGVERGASARLRRPLWGWRGGLKRKQEGAQKLEGGAYKRIYR